MSIFTSLPDDRYSRNAFDGFIIGPDFSCENARALAWMSQLAYETAEPSKIADILKLWGLKIVDDGIIVKEVTTVLPLASTHCFVAAGSKFAIAVVAGTDPVRLANWITDFDAHLDQTTDTANGYQVAADAVWPELQSLIANGAVPDRRIFLAGHSLGGAIASIIAHRIKEKKIANVEAVYTFGMPRAGGSSLTEGYNGLLGSCTYRLVHGEDLVPTVAPSFLNFRHLGRHLHCDRLGKFDPTKLASGTASDDPQFVKGVSKELAEVAHSPLSSVLSVAARLKLAAALLAGAGPAGMRTDLGGIAIELLPPRLRDHMTDRYIAACTP